MSTAHSIVDKKIQQADEQRRVYEEYPPYYVEDEISLIDLWLVLVKRKKLLLAVFAACTLLGLITAFVLPKQYNYTTSIEIGSRIVRDDIRPIEEPQTLLAKVQESYIPLVQHEYLTNHPEDDNVYKLSARIPKGSEIVVLQSKGAEEHATAFITLQQGVVDKVKKDHQRIVDVLRKEAEIERNKAQSKLDELKDEASVLRAKEKRLNDMVQLLTKQIEDTKAHLAKVNQNRARAVGEAKNEAKAMTLLMLDSDIQQQRERLAQLQERLSIDIAEDRDDLEKKLADNKRTQANQNDEVSRLEAQLVNLRETRALVPPMQSNEPSGLSRKIILLLAMVIGAIFAVFVVFFAEFLAKAREQMDNPDTQKETR
jgi:capsular polysaccharide biosynthesis protein